MEMEQWCEESKRSFLESLVMLEEWEEGPNKTWGGRRGHYKAVDKLYQ